MTHASPLFLQDSSTSATPAAVLRAKVAWYRERAEAWCVGIEAIFGDAPGLITGPRTTASPNISDLATIVVSDPVCEPISVYLFHYFC